MMNRESCKIFIIDDDERVRRSLSLLMASAGYETEAFAGPEELLSLREFEGAGCILLDIFLEGPSGLELQEEIIKKFSCLPIIYITGQGDIPMSVQAMKKGAVNFLQKPVDDQLLLRAVEEALHQSIEMCDKQQEENKIRSLFNSLTSRESQIYLLLITGMLNKQIAAELNIAEHTVKLHRGKITNKLGVKSVAELVKLANKLKL